MMSDIFDRGGASFVIHLIQTLLQPAIHPIRHDVEEGQHSHSGTVDHFFLFLKKGVRAGCARIYDCGDARLQREICRNPQRHRMCSSLRSKPVQRRSAVANVVMNVDQSGSHVELRDVHNFSGLICRNIFFDSRNLPLEYRNVTHLINVIGRINNVPAF